MLAVAIALVTKCTRALVRNTSDVYEMKALLPAVLLLHEALVLVEAVVGAADEGGRVGAVLVAERRGAAVRRRHRHHVLPARQPPQLALRPKAFVGPVPY